MPDRPKPLLRLLIKVTRVLFATVTFAALGMGLGLMIGIGYLMVSSSVQHAHPDMTRAYRFAAIPAAAISGAMAFVYTLVAEIRNATRTHA